MAHYRESSKQQQKKRFTHIYIKYTQLPYRLHERGFFPTHLMSY